ncbi:hypothetical protein TGAMA5MH_04059 [Trichoderma gamsii]|uniref:Uncharacterized protein n=1 Tax=Trichoderma gamsii TaxID=398673 RepID=A0A2K0TE51_9HYPO|nr:hypothetical protein TGAMA5MH_04059 [Trichoderma gamsii]
MATELCPVYAVSNHIPGPAIPNDVTENLPERHPNH